MNTKNTNSQNNAIDLCQVRCIHEDRVTKARQHELDNDDNTRLAQIFKALGDPNRLRIIHALGQGEMCVCDIAALLGVSESAVSHQLRQLRQLQLVSNRRQGPVLYYHLKDKHVSEIVRLTYHYMKEK